MSNEPSMEEILSSIKRIIAEEDRAAPAPRAPRRSTPPRGGEAAAQIEGEADDQILELTDIVPGDPQPAAPVTLAKPEIAKPEVAKPAKADSKPEAKMEAKASKSDAKPRLREAVAATAPKTTPETTPEAAIVLSDLSAKAARDSLDHLSRLLVRSDDGPSNTLEGLVREMLRPMLKDWLDAHLPSMVEALVQREIDRITGRV